MYVLLLSLIGVWSISPSNSAALAQEKQTLRYVALGDSLTAGLGASEEEYLRLQAFVPQLTADLRKSKPVYVENHGIPGITSEQLLLYLQQGPGLAQRLEAADLITMTIGGNDLLQLLRGANELPDLMKIKQTIDGFGCTIAKILESIRSFNAQVPIFVMDLYTPYDSEHPLHQLGKEAITYYNTVLAEQIDSLPNVSLVSVYDVFLDQGRTLTHIEQGDIHPNDDGYALIFQAFKDALVANIN